jgi:hypothetical protein
MLAMKWLLVLLLAAPTFAQPSKRTNKSTPRLDENDDPKEIGPKPRLDPFDDVLIPPMQKRVRGEVDPYEMMIPDFVNKVPAAVAPRKVWVQLLDGTSITGSVIAERPDSIFIDCPMGAVSIPRGRLRLVAYDTPLRK